MRKFASVAVALIVATGAMVAVPAKAATKITNGVACTKLNSTTTANTLKYKCAKNPLTTSAKLTWLSLDCLNSANAYVKSQKDTVALTAKLAAQIPIIDTGIVNETAHKAEIQTKIDATNLRLTAAKAKLAAAVTDADKKAYTSAVTAWGSAVRTYTSAINGITADIRKLEAAKSAATTQPAQLATNLANTKTNAQFICRKGL